MANYGDNTISAYSLSTATGVLTPLTGSPFAVPGVGPGPVQIVASGDYLFSANMNAGTVAVFAITSGTGVLTQGINGSPFATDVRPRSIAVDPTGKVLYTANAGAGGAGSISGYTVDLSSGALTPVAGSPFPIPVTYNIGIDSQSRYLFVTEAAGVAVYPIVNTATGLLNSPVAGSPFAAGTTPFSVSIDLADQFVYVANDGSASVSQYTFSPATGVLTPVAVRRSPRARVRTTSRSSEPRAARGVRRAHERMRSPSGSNGGSAMMRAGRRSPRISISNARGAGPAASAFGT